MSTPSHVDAALQLKYNQYYADGQSEWRRLGAIDKVRNIQAVCEGRTFSNVVDVGAGEGSVTARLDELRFAPNLYALEISESGHSTILGREIPSLREARLFDGYHVPYGDATFDLAIATHVLEHVEHERLFLKELKRVSRAVFIEVPLEDTIRVSKSVANDIGHINFYRQETLLALLKSSGLTPVRWRLFDHSPAVSRFRSGVVGGLGRQIIRGSLLRWTPRLAQHLFAYHLAVLCEA